MSNVATILWLIPALPLAAAVLTAVLGPRLLRQQSAWPCVLALAGSCVLSFLVLIQVSGLDSSVLSARPAGPPKTTWIPKPPEPPVPLHKYTWFRVGNVDVD